MQHNTLFPVSYNSLLYDANTRNVNELSHNNAIQPKITLNHVLQSNLKLLNSYKIAGYIVSTRALITHMITVYKCECKCT